MPRLLSPPFPAAFVSGRTILRRLPALRARASSPSAAREKNEKTNLGGLRMGEMGAGHMGEVGAGHMGEVRAARKKNEKRISGDMYGGNGRGRPMCKRWCRILPPLSRASHPYCEWHPQCERAPRPSPRGQGGGQDGG